MTGDPTGDVSRRLAAILFAGYKRLQPGDEASTFTGFTLLRAEIIEPQVLKFGGHIIRWTGDEVVFLEFPSVFGAVRCAAALIEAASRLNEATLPDRRIALSIGINLDDIIIKDGDFFGDGVNIAARLEALADAMLAFRQLFDPTSSTYTYLLADGGSGAAVIADSGS